MTLMQKLADIGFTYRPMLASFVSHPTDFLNARNLSNLSIISVYFLVLGLRMTPYLMPAESISGLWEIACIAGTLLTTVFVWFCSLR